MINVFDERESLERYELCVVSPLTRPYRGYSPMLGVARMPSRSCLDRSYRATPVNHTYKELAGLPIRLKSKNQKKKTSSKKVSYFSLALLLHAHEIELQACTCFGLISNTPFISVILRTSARCETTKEKMNADQHQPSA